MTQSDRFRFATVDFDVGRRWQDGALKMRAFGGLRAMGTDQSFNISDSEAKGFFISSGPDSFAFNANSLQHSAGRSNFVGVGPRIGIEGFYGEKDAFFGTTVGLVGSVSAAYIAGWRYSTFTSSGSGSFSFSENGIGGSFNTGPIPLSPFDASARRSGYAGVGDVSAAGRHLHGKGGLAPLGADRRDASGAQGVQAAHGTQ